VSLTLSCFQFTDIVDTQFVACFSGRRQAILRHDLWPQCCIVFSAILRGLSYLGLDSKFLNYEGVFFDLNTYDLTGHVWWWLRVKANISDAPGISGLRATTRDWWRLGQGRFTYSQVCITTSLLNELTSTGRDYGLRSIFWHCAHLIWRFHLKIFDFIWLNRKINYFIVAVWIYGWCKVTLFSGGALGLCPTNLKVMGLVK